MNEWTVGTVRRVVGPVVETTCTGDAQMLELVYVGDHRLIGEVVRIRQRTAWVQVYEDTTGLRPGAPVYGSGEPLSVELGPGLIGAIYDGVQRPLDTLRKKAGDFISKGIDAPALDRQKKWHFVPVLKARCPVTGGMVLGHVRETDAILHKVMVPPAIYGDLYMIAEEGDYRVEEIIATIHNHGHAVELPLFHEWPVRKARPHAGHLHLARPLITGQRVIDTLFPVARGGVVVVPGGFGTGKTMIQHALAKWCDADVVVYIGCGERGNEMTEVLTEFPKLIDPRTERPLMDRTILIANTSNMPVAAREASIYTGITIAEYFRDMGYDVAVMADSTSRWAEALRELSGRMEEMPAEEGFPAYLPTRLAEFYERAGMVKTLAGDEASITTIGAVSPPGGDFSEPVTRQTKRFIRTFWALDKQLANSRHYPAINWLDSYSEYVDDIAEWWDATAKGEWKARRAAILSIMQREAKLERVVKLVGADVLPDSQRVVLEAAAMFKNAFLQQNSYDKMDAFCSAEKQSRMLEIILTYFDLVSEAINRGASLADFSKLEVVRDIMQMKFECGNEDAAKLDAILAKLKASVQERQHAHA
ncbi:MAG: V-type ATP synthase subunit A [Candidatus Hydrogenedentes bacterium]|nr:V-type ATP synthase subunit A [Candidatus Hydrogenedentota bacterium]